MHLRVLTLNVWNTEGDPRRFDLVTRELRRIDPDLVALQEVVHTPRHNQLEVLLNGTQLHRTHQAQIMTTVPPGADRYGGSAIATRWPHRIVEVLDLRLVDAVDVPWCTLAAVVQLPEVGDLLFIATTTAWRLDAESAPERQMMALADLDARHRRVLPTIIAGDFNAAPDASSIRFFAGLQSLGGRSVHYHDAWAVAGKGPGHTWTSDNPNANSQIDKIIRQPNHRRRIDYIFVGSWHAHPRAQCSVQACKLAFDRPRKGIWPSDHFGVVADLDVAKDA